MAQNINVDVTPNLFQPTLYYHQGDIGRAFTITISTKDGYTIPSGATVKIEATKPSGLGFSVSGTLSGNVVSFVSTEGMTDEYGRFPAQLKITSGNDILYTANFLMVGAINTHPASVTDGTAEQVISEITLLVERAESAASTAATDAANAAQARVDEMMDYLPSEVADLKSELTSEADARIALASRVATAETDIDTLEIHKVAQPLDEFNQPTNGTSGQSLRTKGDGTTEWADVGLPTDEQTAQAVSDWLDEHPEATTTVQDGSITSAKLSSELRKNKWYNECLLTASGDADTDTANIQYAFNNYINVKFSAENGEFKINAPIEIPAVPTEYAQTGRVVDFNKCVIRATEEIDYLFHFNGGEWGSNLRDVKVKGGRFGGTVTNCAILIDGSTMWGCVVDDFQGLTDFYADSLINICSQLADYNSGNNVVTNINGGLHAKYALKFSKSTSGNLQFDDFYIRGIRSSYMDGAGAAIGLDGVYLVYSTISMLYAGESASAIRDASVSYMIDCSVSNVYHEAGANNYYTILINVLRCRFNNVHTKLRDSSYTGVMFYGESTQTEFNQFIKTNNDGTEVTDTYINIAGGTGNNYLHKIGTGLSSRSLVMASSSLNNRIEGGFNAPILLSDGGNIKTYNNQTASHDRLIKLYKEYFKNGLFKCKIIGAATASNAFTVDLVGTGVNINLYTNTGTGGAFEVDIEFPFRDNSYLQFLSKAYESGNIAKFVSQGRAEQGLVPITDDLQIEINVSTGNYISIMFVGAESIPNQIYRPTTA